MTHSRCFVLVVLFLLTARAASAKELDEREATARTACLAGDYTKGVAILAELFSATEDAVYIYNQARCFEQNRRYQDAVAQFQEYLKTARKLSKSDKADAQKRIAHCQELLAKQDASGSAAGAGESREAKERAARKACQSNDLAQGIQLLSQLYLDTNDPTYLYNQGRCYEQNSVCDEAITRFREYLQKTPDGTEGDRADVAKRIGDCEASLTKQGRRGTATSVATGSPGSSAGAMEPAAGAPGAAPAVTPGEAVVSSPSGQARPGGGLRLAGVVTMGAGGALLVGGLVLNLQHNNKIHDLHGDYAGDTADSAQLYKTLSMVGYAAGAACLAGGAVLYWLGHRAGTLTVVPDVAAGRTGLQLAGGF
jgi:tetratricopeptide (TPR) repeat protein